MGNLLAECRRCSSIDQCELCTEVLTSQFVRRSASPGPSGRQGGRSGAAGEAGRRGGGPAGWPDGPDWAGHDGDLLGDEDQQLMAAIAASYAGAGGGALTEEELMVQAVVRSKNEAEAQERERLRLEQATEYEESLRIDQQRELERMLKKKEEEEESRKAAEEEEAKRQESLFKRAEALAAEKALQAMVAAIVEEAQSRLSPEPAKDEPNCTVVQVRIPDGRRLRRSFRAADAVQQLYDFALSEGGEALGAQAFRLVSAMPRTIYEDRSITLAEANLQGQCALLVEIIEDDDQSLKSSR
jgi:hypothetical protein